MAILFFDKYLLAQQLKFRRDAKKNSTIFERRKKVHLLPSKTAVQGGWINKAPKNLGGPSARGQGVCLLENAQTTMNGGKFDEMLHSGQFSKQK